MFNFEYNKEARAYEYQPRSNEEVKELIEVNSIDLLPFVPEKKREEMTPVEAATVSKIESLKQNITRLERPNFDTVGASGLKKACEELGIEFDGRMNDRTLRKLLNTFYDGQVALHMHLFPEAYQEDIPSPTTDSATEAGSVSDGETPQSKTPNPSPDDGESA